MKQRNALASDECQVLVVISQKRDSAISTIFINAWYFCLFPNKRRNIVVFFLKRTSFVEKDVSRKKVLNHLKCSVTKTCLYAWIGFFMLMKIVSKGDIWKCSLLWGTSHNKRRVKRDVLLGLTHYLLLKEFIFLLFNGH